MPDRGIFDKKLLSYSDIEERYIITDNDKSVNYDLAIIDSNYEAARFIKDFNKNLPIISRVGRFLRREDAVN